MPRIWDIKKMRSWIPNMWVSDHIWDWTQWVPDARKIDSNIDKAWTAAQWLRKAEDDANIKRATTINDNTYYNNWVEQLNKEQETQEKTPSNNWWWAKRRFIKPIQTPTYKTLDWNTWTGMTQEEYSNLITNEAADERAYQDMMANRNRTVGNSNITADQIFHQAIEKASSNPDAFTAEQKAQLINLWRQLWYYSWSASDQQSAVTAQQPATNVTNVQQPNTQPLPYNNDVSNYGWRYWQNSWNNYTRQVQWAGNAAFFTL